MILRQHKDNNKLICFKKYKKSIQKHQLVFFGVKEVINLILNKHLD